MRHNFHKETVRCWQNSYITFSAGTAIVIVVPGNLEVLFFLITYNIVQTALLIYIVFPLKADSGSVLKGVQQSSM